MPMYAQDTQKTGSGIMLNGMILHDADGQILRAVLIEAKNYQRIQAFGISPNGYVA